MVCWAMHPPFPSTLVPAPNATPEMIVEPISQNREILAKNHRNWLHEKKVITLEKKNWEGHRHPRLLSTHQRTSNDERSQVILAMV